MYRDYACLEVEVTYSRTDKTRSTNVTGATRSIPLYKVILRTPNVKHSGCVCNKLKIHLSSFKTQLYYLVKNPHILANVSSHHQADHKNIKRKKGHNTVSVPV
jgi:hypothetical protein